MRVIPAFFIAISVSLGTGAWASTNLDTGTQAQLVQLERQYFKCNFDTDGDDSRVQRLEKLVFGQGGTGDPGPRVKKLYEAAMGAAASSDEDAPKSAQTASPMADSPMAEPQQSSSNADSTAKTARVSVDDPDSSEVKYPRISELEKAILSQTFEKQPLPDRLSRMETKAFGNPCTDKDLSDRTDALETYVNKKLHKKTLEQEQRSDTATNSSQPAPGRAQKLLSMVGKSLLGIGAGGGPGAGGASFGPAMGSGFGPGFGRMGRRQQMQQPQPTAAPAPPKPDDPAVHAAAPPSANARFSTQVGWCEVQVFGHTFPDKHLPDRLGQLNRELQYKPGETDMALMDDMSGLIKAVQVQQSRRSIGSAPGSPTR